MNNLATNFMKLMLFMFSTQGLLKIITDEKTLCGHRALVRLHDGKEYVIEVKLRHQPKEEPKKLTIRKWLELTSYFAGKG